MTTAAQATGAPVPVKLAGQSFRMSPLSDEDYAEFESWMQSRPIEVAREDSRRLNLIKDEKEVLLKQAMEISARLTITSLEGMQVMTSLKGATYLTWLGLKKCHPDLTVPQVAALLSDPITLQDAMTHFDRVNKLETEEDEKKGGLKKIRKGKPKTKLSTGPRSTDT